MFFSDDVINNKLFVAAQDEAKRLKDEYVSVEHLVLAMFDESSSTGIGKIFRSGIKER